MCSYLSIKDEKIFVVAIFTIYAIKINMSMPYSFLLLIDVVLICVWNETVGSAWVR